MPARTAGWSAGTGLIAAVDTDADNVYVTLSSRALRPDLVIIARARTESSKSKLVRAGADRAVNPQLIGGRRVAAFALQPHVAEFLDVVMNEGALEFRMEQVEIPVASRVAGLSLREAALDASGALLLALRPGNTGPFLPNPSAGTRLEAHTILIAVGTPRNSTRCGSIAERHDSAAEGNLRQPCGRVELAAGRSPSFPARANGRPTTSL